MELAEFVLTHLPEPPARVLEVGCGKGELARALAAAGHDVLAIDPDAPAGPPFRRVTLEDLVAPEPFDAVVASRSLHHLADLGLAVDRIALLLRSGGAVIVNDFAKERLAGATAEWYYEQRRVLEAACGKAAPASFHECLHEEHADIHTFAAMRSELDRRFDERFFGWLPYLHEELQGVVSAEQERALVAAGAIQATGFRYVGEDARP